MIKKLGTDYIDPFITALVYGGPGVGKTIFAGGSQYLRTFFFDIDKGMDSLASRKTDEKLIAVGLPPIKRENIDYETIYTYADFESALSRFEREKDRFDLVVVDTWSELLKLILAQSKAKGKRVKAERDDWGIVLDSMEYLTRTFRDMRKHTILLSHEVVMFDGRIVPNFKGQYKADYAQAFSLIMRYFLVDESVVDPTTQTLQTVTHRLLNCNREPLIDAKDRSSSLEKYEIPYLDNILWKYTSAMQNNGG